MRIFDWLKPKWDQRRLPRLRSYCLINYSKLSGAEVAATNEVSNIRDISTTGLQFTAYEPLKKGILLDLKVNLPDLDKPLCARARVVWSKKLKRESDAYRVGVAFLELSTEERDLIAKHVHHAASDKLGKKLILGKSFLQRLRKSP